MTSKSQKMNPSDNCVSDTSLQVFLGYHLRRASNALMVDLAKTLEAHGLRMITFTALKLIIENPGLSQSQLAAAMDVERSNLVVIIDELERRDLITRDRVPTDRRAYALNATLKGRQLSEAATKDVITHEAKMLAGLDENTRNMVEQAMARIMNRS